MSYADLLASTVAGDDDTGAGELGLGLLDAGRSMLTGGIAQGAGLANQGILRLFGASPDQAAAFGGKVQDALTAPPRTVWGARALNTIGNLFEGAANSAPIRAIADPLERGLLKTGIAPADLAGLTGAAGLLVGGPEEGALTRLRGLPAKLGEFDVAPSAAARQAATDYMASTGRPYEPPTSFVPLNPARSQRLADAYEAMPHEPNNPKVMKAYDALISETLGQYEAMQKAGVKVEMIPAGMEDPYKGSPRNAIEDVKNNNHLWVFPTEGGFGSGAGAAEAAASHPLLAPTSAVDANGRPMLANDVFRAVHDYFGHAKEGVGFRAPGEDNAYLQHAAMFSPEARAAMATETRGQNSWVNFGPYAEQNRGANVLDTTYAQQKAGLLDPALYSTYPQYAERYPTVPEPELKTDPKTGKQYLAKGSSPETEDFMKARLAVQRDIDAGNYSPYFDVPNRFDADVARYPAEGNTLTDTLPKKQATIDRHTAAIDTPAARARLNEAYDAGLSSGGHDRWYQMGQLEHEFIDELGPEAGPAAFKSRFADAMAATTGGADPTSNLLMAGYGNFLHSHGMPIPDAAYKMPVPIGGRYVTGNMAQYGGLLDRGSIPITNEKRFDFSRNFLGDRGPATIDEQMTDLMTPGQNAPGTGQYGIYENLLGDVAAQRGLSPRDFQDVAWGGKKNLATGGSYQGKPMIQHVNEAIERTSRLTGLSPREVVRRGLVRGQIPIYGLAGITAGAGLLGNYGGTND